MKCRFCGKRAEIVIRRHRISLCTTCYPGFFEKQVMHAIERGKMFSREDRICVAVSGGKDSMSLIHALNKLGFDVVAVHIDLGIEKYSKECRKVVESYCRSSHIPLVVYDLKEMKHASITDLAVKETRPPCSICGAIKRQLTNKLAREEGCKALATGHNLDDELVFLFSNLLRADTVSLAKQKPVLPASGLMIRKVKPLYRLTDQEVMFYVETEHIPYHHGTCPLSGEASTLLYKNWWNELEEKKPGIKASFYFGFLRKIQPVLERNVEQEQSMIQECEVCGEPTSRKVCSVCALFDKRVVRKHDQKQV